MAGDEQASAERAERASQLKARGRWWAALGAIVGAIWSAVATVIVLAPGDDSLGFSAPPPPGEEPAMSPELRGLIVLAWVFFVAVLRALVSTRQAGMARSTWAVAAFGVACVPLAAGFVWHSPVVDTMEALGLLLSSVAIFGGLIVQDELTLRAERLEDQVAEEAERKRRQREADLRWYEQELSRVEGKLEELTSREAERRGMWCFWRR
ncbi:hypothetical protein [Micrococcus luteus]|uniref:hypothetical protein n=1 Tax=Micrococcus luteus TaxID=1270 RepID=UPI0034052546